MDGAIEWEAWRREARRARHCRFQRYCGALRAWGLSSALQDLPLHLFDKAFPQMD